MVRTLTEALRVNESSVFELIHRTFYERDFIFFAQLVEHLGDLFHSDKSELLGFAKLSQLLYLSSLLHYSLNEDTNTVEELRAEKQMPVLLGDLLYGRFISELIKTNKSEYLTFYLKYLKQFNICGVEDLENRFVFTEASMASMLMEQTARVFAAFTGNDTMDTLFEAELFFAEEWELRRGNKITTLDELEDLLYKTFGQEAMVC